MENPWVQCHKHFFKIECYLSNLQYCLWLIKTWLQNSNHNVLFHNNLLWTFFMKLSVTSLICNIASDLLKHGFKIPITMYNFKIIFMKLPLGVNLIILLYSGICLWHHLGTCSELRVYHRERKAQLNLALRLKSRFDQLLVFCERSMGSPAPSILQTPVWIHRFHIFIDTFICHEK